MGGSSFSCSGGWAVRHLPELFLFFLCDPFFLDTRARISCSPPTHSVRGQPRTHQPGSSSYWLEQGLVFKPQILPPEKDVGTSPAHNCCSSKNSTQALAGVAQWTECLRTKGLLVQFPVRARAWVAGQVPSWGSQLRGNHR